MIAESSTCINKEYMLKKECQKRSGKEKSWNRDRSWRQ